MNEVVDMNKLYNAFKASMNGSSWKSQPQKFELDVLSELFKLKRELLDDTYQITPGSEFILNERGKIRYIHGGSMRDRVIEHWLCDDEINPAIQPYLIFNNGASQKDKGITFSRRLFEKDLHNFYLKYGDNQGYVGFVDMSKFYDNIHHDKAKSQLEPLIDPFPFHVFSKILDSFQVDVSYMSDEEYKTCLYLMFNSIEYYRSIPKSKMTGEKLMPKSVNIGDQIAQSIGIYYPITIDNYAKIVRGCKWYGRYMDDIYVIQRDKEELISVLEGIQQKANEIGLFVNPKKTRIAKLSNVYSYLQYKYSLLENGKIVKRINPKSVTRERRRMKAYKRLLDRGEMDYDAIEQACKSWMGAFAKVMSKQQIKHMKQTYYDLFGKELSWKRK